MNAQWKQARARFRAMPRRERLLLPGAICFAILMLGHLLFFEPARKQLRLVQQQFEQENGELTVAQTQLQILRDKLANPDAELRSQLAALQLQARSADDKFAELQGSLVPAQEMSHWLSGLMQSQRGVQLLGLKSLPVTSVNDLLTGKPGAAPTPTPTSTPTLAAATEAPAPAAGASQAAGPASDTWLYRHGVEITLRGSYADLLAYVKALEHLPRRVYWGELRLDAQDSPAVVMTLTVYTISLEKSWWVI